MIQCTMIELVFVPDLSNRLLSSKNIKDSQRTISGHLDENIASRNSNDAQKEIID